MKTLRLALLLLLLAASPLAAQTSLSIVDVLPPYDLTATLLANGHFSVSTRYTGERKTLIYQEDGTGGRPVNYTSHVHFKVDNVIFQLPYELDPVTRDVPPPNPLTVARLHRDTAAGAPCVHADMFGVMPDGDTIRFLFSMQPVKRPSGGFIRLSAEVYNSTSRARSVGVLMLIDTKIGENDRAPIISSFGYNTRETEFERATAPGMPEFWLGLEGTPVDPKLTARGNLRAPGLLEPDYFLFGNWKDNTAVPGAFGLAMAQWNERRAVDADYTDSAILLLWGEQMMARGERRLRASTEIGIVDSLKVSTGAGGVSMGGAGGGNGAGGCLGFDTVAQVPCDDPAYHPYLPDSLQTLYIVTNGGTSQINAARVVVPALPAGLSMGRTSSGVIPGSIPVGVTGVATLTFYAEPRLWSKAYSVPIALVTGAGDTAVRDTLCISVPGLLGELRATPLEFLPLCPGLSDTLDLRVRLRGARCLDLDPAAVIVGTPGDVAQFEIVPPVPTRIPANGEAIFRVRYTAGANGTTHRAGLRISTTQRGLDSNDLPATVITSDTIPLTGISRDAEFFMADPADTLDLGSVCVGDTTVGDWDISNVGGCEVLIGADYIVENDPQGYFSVENAADFPLTILRGRDARVSLRFAPRTPGAVLARFIVRSTAAPFADTLIVRGRGDLPQFSVEPPLAADTLCPGERLTLQIPVTNPTACPVAITSVVSDNTLFTVDAPGGFVIPPHASRAIFVEGEFTAPGEYRAGLRITSAGAGEQSLEVRAVVASRELIYPEKMEFGDVRRGASRGPERIVIASAGTAGVEITRIAIAGGNASEYAYTLPNGESLPLWLAPGRTLEVDVTFTPADLDLRRARLVVETSSRTICSLPKPAELTGRGVLPVIDAPRKFYDLGRICAGRSLDTVVLVRNRGNAPLTVTGVETDLADGRAAVSVQGLPVTIGPDSSFAVPVRVIPELLGPLGVDLRFLSDGEPFVPSDTLVRLAGAGVLCGTAWVDTITAQVGEVVHVPVYLDASPLTPAQVARLLNESNQRAISFTIGHDARLLRFLAEPPSAGMLAGLDPTAQVLPGGSAVRVAGTGTGGDLRDAREIAVLSADLLLGDKDRTALTLNLLDIAGGYADITVRNGLLLAEYCALDRRYVKIAGPLLRPARTPLGRDGELLLHLPEAAHARLLLYDALGNHVATLLEDDMRAGTRRIALGEYHLSSGSYQAVVEAAGERVVTPLVVVE